MIVPPTFSSDQEYVSRLRDVGFWRPYVEDVLGRHDLVESGEELVPGVGGTYPTFVQAGVVVKLLGYVRPPRDSNEVELAALETLAADPEIKAPRLLARGQVFDNSADPWSYLITTRMPGVAWEYAGLTFEQKRSLAAELGQQVRRVHSLHPRGFAPHEYQSADRVAAACVTSSLPSHLVAQIDDYLARSGQMEPVFAHGDMMYRHIFVEDGCLTGIIDWGDATVIDRHYEFGKLHLDLFECDKTLLRVFLEASEWPATEDFPQMAMALALHRQAERKTLKMDVFYTLPNLLPLQDIATLDDLATVLFAV
ncbi:MAG: phosphotransferase [Chloroflexi bacterium]|nr:phosphotransferase [Chloroflexota bacterium]